jgi:hypothetical protein
VKRISEASLKIQAGFVILCAVTGFIIGFILAEIFRGHL